MKNKTDKTLAAAAIAVWLGSLMIVLAFWGLVIWGLIELILFIRAS